MKNPCSYLAGVTMKTGSLFLLLAAAALGTACGEAIDINRVAPNAIEKSIFEGEWYYRPLLVDKQFHTDNAFIGYEGELDRIKWEITETRLIGYRSYERVPGSDPSNPGEQNVVVSFEISSHFDIKRQYNPTNGVESNVIEENTVDRPWFERDFMRVAWGDQKSVTLGLEQQVLNSNGVNRNSNETPNYPWKVRFGQKLIGNDPIRDEGFDYFENTIDGMANPDPYICYYLDGLSPCNAASVKVKLSFKKVPAVNDYEALDYPDFVPLQSGGLVLAETGEAVATSTSNDLVASGDAPIQRICSPAEMDRDGSALMRIVDDTFGPRVCNPDPTFGDAASACRDDLVRCEVEVGSDNIAITPNNNPVCDPNHHSPDDCVELTTNVFSRFGYFRTDRFAIDRENGTQYNARERLINRHNIWAKSFDDASGRPLPMDKRPVKPIIYYLNVGFPTDLIQVTQEKLVPDWDQAFRDAVAAARGLKGAHQLPANLNEGFEGFDAVEHMFEIRTNDCNIGAVNEYANKNDMTEALMDNRVGVVGYGNLEEACAVLEFESKRRAAAGEKIAVFEWQQLGDLRFNFLNWTAKAELAGPLGYGPSAADPLTGEIISANANMYGASLDTYANWGADIVQLLNGDLSTEDIINGTAAREHVEGVRNRWAKAYTKEKVDAFMRTFDNRADRMSENNYFKKLPASAINNGLKRMRESGVEDEVLMTSETLRLFGNDPQAVAEGRITARMMDNARPSAWAGEKIPDQMLVAANAGHIGTVSEQAFSPSLNTAGGRGFEELADYLGRQNFCFTSAQVEPAIADLADQVKDLGLNRDEIVKFIREGVYVGVTAHELGHTFGLRHNFEGSADAMNYFPDFWGLTGDSLPAGKDHLMAKGGYTVNDSERRAYQYSSIMDYHQRFNADWAGIGLYDKAAIKLGYAETVEVFDETQGNFVARDWIRNTFLLDPQDFRSLVAGPDADREIDRLFDDAYELQSVGDDTATMDIANSGIPGLAPRPENLFKRKDIPLRDWFRNELIINRFVGGLDDSECGDFNLPVQPGCMQFLLKVNGLTDDDGGLPKVTVPYQFCGDEFAFGGNLTCNRYDMGATSREIVRNAGEMYEFYYPFDAFRRERVLNPFGSWAGSYINRLQTRTYQPMLNAYRFFYYYRRAQTLRVYPTIRDWGTAALVGMDFFVRVLQQPEPGTYCKVGDTYQPESQADAAACTADSVELGLGDGRLLNSSWDNEYDFRPVNLGNYWDKAIAIQSMTSSDAFFFRDFSQETNRGAFSIGYYRIFQDEMLDLFGSLLLDETSTFSPRVFDEDGDGDVEVLYQPFLKTGIYGEELPDNGATAGTPIRPGTSYQLRHWAAVFSMFQLTSTLDQTLDFATRARITLAGQPGEATITTDTDGDGVDDIEIMEFVDPQTQLVYRSVSVDDPDRSVGFRLLGDAKTFADGEWQDAQDALDTAEAGADVEAIRAARIVAERANQRLNEKMQIIDFMVGLGNDVVFPGG